MPNLLSRDKKVRLSPDSNNEFDLTENDEEEETVLPDQFDDEFGLTSVTHGVFGGSKRREKRSRNNFLISPGTPSTPPELEDPFLKSIKGILEADEVSKRKQEDLQQKKFASDQLFQ